MEKSSSIEFHLQPGKEKEKEERKHRERTPLVVRAGIIPWQRVVGGSFLLGFQLGKPREKQEAEGAKNI